VYVRTTVRRNRDGSVVRYLQLAHNVWDAERRQSRTRVLQSLGREDELDRESLTRLVRSLSRFLGREPEAVAAQIRFLGARPWGDRFVLDRLWQRVGMEEALRRALPGQRLAAGSEGVVLDLVADRAIGARSGHDGAAGAVARAEAIDFLVDAEEGIQREVFSSVAAGADLDVDTVMVGITPVSFSGKDDDEVGGGIPGVADRVEARVGLGVVKGGVPMRAWAFPPGAPDVVERVSDDLAAWRLRRVVWAGGDRLTRAERASVRRYGGHVLDQEPLGGRGSPIATPRPDCYQRVSEGLEAQEVWVGTGKSPRRLVVCRDQRLVEEERARRRTAVAWLEAELEALAAMAGETRARAEAELLAHPGLGRYLARRHGRLTLDRARLRADDRSGGTVVLSCSDGSLAAADLAERHRGLADVERAWARLHHVVPGYPVHRRAEERLRAHVTLGLLALVLVRAAERASGWAWRELLGELDRMQVGEFADAAGRVVRRTETTPTQRRLLRALGIDEPAWVTG
jgi:hypothetical protein